MVRVTNKHRLGRALRRSGSGSFAIKEVVKRVQKCRVNHGLNPSNYTQSCIEGYLWSLLLDGKFTVRKTPEGVYRFRPTPETASILRAARAQFPSKASTLKIGTYIWSKVGPIPTMTKRELFVLLYERGLMTAATAEAEAEDDADVEMDVDSDNFEEAPQLDVPVPVQGQAGGSAGQPHTPQRSRPPQGCYPTPPNTTSPIARYDSRVSVLHEDQVGSFVAGAMDPSSSASPTGEANSDLPGADNASCTRPQCQQLEQEYQRTRADLVAAQAEAAEQRDELQVLKLLQVDMEDRLSDAFSRNEHLADERDMYKKKHCGAEAALKGSQAVAHTMQSKMAQCLAQFRFM